MEVYTSKDPGHWLIPLSMEKNKLERSTLEEGESCYVYLPLIWAPLLYMWWGFPQAAQEKVQTVGREACITSRMLLLWRDLVRSTRSLGSLLHACPQSHGCVWFSLSFPSTEPKQVELTSGWDQGSPMSLSAKDGHIQPGQRLANER